MYEFEFFEAKLLFTLHHQLILGCLRILVFFFELNKITENFWKMHSWTTKAFSTKLFILSSSIIYVSQSVFTLHSSLHSLSGWQASRQDRMVFNNWGWESGSPTVMTPVSMDISISGGNHRILLENGITWTHSL